MVLGGHPAPQLRMRRGRSHGSSPRSGRDVLGRQAASAVGSRGLEWAPCPRSISLLASEGTRSDTERL